MTTSLDTRAVRTKEAPEPIGPYSQALVHRDLVWCSGQIGLDPDTGKLVSGGISEQTDRAIRNLRAVLQGAGSGLESVLKTTVFLKSINDFAAFNETYSRYFGESKPARSTVEVSGLPKGALVEIDAVASVR